MARILAFRRGYGSRIKPVEALLVVLVGIMAGLLYYPALGVIQDWRRPGLDAPLPPTGDPYPKEWEKSRESREIQREQEGRPTSELPGERGGTDSGSSVGAAIRVVDGDTFWLGNDKIRIADIDTPETHPPRCAYEAQLGERATRRLQVLLGQGPFVLEAIDRDTDRHGRKLRIVTRGGRSLGDQLVAEGLARPYAGGRRPWCG